MNEVNFGDLVGRMAVSMLVVLTLLLVAYRVIKRRQSASLGSGSFARGVARRLGRQDPGAGSSASRGGNTKRGLKILARIGLSRTSTVVAVQFGDRVYMLGTSEQSPPTVLADIESAAWSAAIEAGEEPVAVTRVPLAATDGSTRQGSNLLDALRAATARRG